MKAATLRKLSDHMTVERFDGVVTVSFSDAIIASSDNAKIVSEPGHEPVFYIPFDDIYFNFLEKTNTVSDDAFKGKASYWRVSAVGQAADDFMWAYETPNPDAAVLHRHGTFDDKKAVIEVAPNDEQPIVT